VNPAGAVAMTIVGDLLNFLFLTTILGVPLSIIILVLAILYISGSAQRAAAGPRGLLDDAAQLLELILIPIFIMVVLYGSFSAYLTDLWRGFMLGIFVVFLPMSVINIYMGRRNRSAGSPASSPRTEGSHVGSSRPVFAASAPTPARTPRLSSPIVQFRPPVTRAQPAIARSVSPATERQTKQVGTGIDSINIARNLVRSRLGDTQVNIWYRESSSKDEQGRTTVTGYAVDENRAMHFFRVLMSREGKVQYDESYVR
jgi:hypothetical protein